MSLKLKSGFTFDYDNLYGEGKVTEADLKSYEEDLKNARRDSSVRISRRMANRRKSCSPSCRT